MLQREFFVGLDLGQKRDFTALVVLERALVRTDEIDWITRTPVTRVRWRAVLCERMRLGTRYPAIVDAVRQRVRHLAEEGWCTLAVDETGVGAPVVDLLRGADLRSRLIPITITSGGAARRTQGGGWAVPKRELLSAMRVLFERSRLQVASDSGGQALVTELRNMRVRVSASGYESYAARTESAHDDLAMALGLACWTGVKMRRETAAA